VPYATTGVAPCTLFLHRNVRTRFDLLRPDREKWVTEKQALQKDYQDLHVRDRSWYVGERVMVQNFRPGSGAAWIPGVVMERLGPVTYLVDVNNDQIWKRHADQLKSITDPPMVSDEMPQIPLGVEDDDVGIDTLVDTPTELPMSDAQEATEGTPSSPPTSPVSSAPVPPPTQSETGTTSRYPSRERRKPDWYDRHK